MKRISTLLLFLLTLLTGYAQNPFATYGYKPKMATLSNGRFDEFHDKDRIIEIGSVKFDTKTNKIVGPAESDTLDTVMDIQTVSRFISIDPHAERYYSISPYAYCNNNPVNCIDPDGRDWYRHNETGNYYWQEGHDELEGYTNVGTSVSIQLGEDSYFNAYQNAGIMANQAVDAFGLISSSGKLQNQFLGKNSPLSENSKSELFNALVNQETSAIGLKIGKGLLTAEMIASGASTIWSLGRLSIYVSSRLFPKMGGNIFNKAVAQITTRIGRDGKAVEVIFKDGSKIDINATRVKEWIPQNHPNAPSGTLQKIKFEESLPGSKGYKRPPTTEEIKFLNSLFK
ncbi:RHS repeat-associated core domain-containing protein [Bacteroides sp.]|uniref:RHS repeat-associated core domain-containing protein n=1 Tax=Bacteroides sp. TaxID=29523 RepID=UPI0025B9C571|nr:RHS repeat-associated core domain-containing protein [Bacteroides sp.]